MAASWKPPTEVPDIPPSHSFHTQPISPPASCSQITSTQRPLNSTLAPFLPMPLQGSLPMGQGDGYPMNCHAGSWLQGAPGGGCWSQPGLRWLSALHQPLPYRRVLVLQAAWLGSFKAPMEELRSCSSRRPLKFNRAAWRGLPGLPPRPPLPAPSCAGAWAPHH